MHRTIAVIFHNDVQTLWNAFQNDWILFRNDFFEMISSKMNRNILIQIFVGQDGVGQSGKMSGFQAAIFLIFEIMIFF